MPSPTTTNPPIAITPKPSPSNNTHHLRRKRSNSDTHLTYIRSQSAHRSALFHSAATAMSTASSSTSDPLTSLLAKHTSLRTYADTLISRTHTDPRLHPMQRRDDGYTHYDRLARGHKHKHEHDEIDATARWRFRWYLASGERGENAEESELMVFEELRACAAETACIVAKTKRMGLKGWLGGREWAWGVAALAVGYEVHDATLLRLKALLQYGLRRLDESPGAEGAVTGVVKAAVRVWAMLEHDLKNVRLMYLVDVVNAWKEKMAVSRAYVHLLLSADSRSQEAPEGPKRKNVDKDGFPFPLVLAVPRTRRRQTVTAETPLPDPFQDNSDNEESGDMPSSPLISESDRPVEHSDDEQDEGFGKGMEIGYALKRMSLKPTVERRTTS
ncbi:hypothetical protein EJ05DRAFT_353592 [Pseudovirgaria hyperparasitica]|uniref:Uncharacterized protein n=1 Tax=Pseudovirgaria hyperparasitica TaxID=470096 RepID=A0A6A6W8I1_9PEZI|nr:uncharacterized protein EJ05DRAFT_353592 [Pseudovirgaria hyperparasitica]KAF2758519.1 hypothetical protein EJ05DRAFT_353592 [Pseudovirgaria hyperparasitica]